MHFTHSCSAPTRLLQRSMEPYLLSKSNRVASEQERKIIMLVAIINFLRAWRRYNAGLNELYRLGDRELADIGISRGDIPRVAWENAHRIA
jgi:uncharacterized protein YjiS (DUF1127 family)